MSSLTFSQEPIFLPTPVVSNYRVEAVFLPDMLGSEGLCKKSALRSFASTPDEEAGYFLKVLASVAATGSGGSPLRPTEFLMPYIDSAAYWWGTLGGASSALTMYLREAVYVPKDPINGPTDLETASLELAKATAEEKQATAYLAKSTRPVSRWDHEKRELLGPQPLVCLNSWMQLAREALTHASVVGLGDKGLWAEFGVASGKSGAYIAHFLAKNYGTPRNENIGDGVNMRNPFRFDEAGQIEKEVPILHGFDSFVGIPESWNSLQQGTFSMGGEIPAIVGDLPNVEIHVGWFNETKRDLDDLSQHGLSHDLDVKPFSIADLQPQNPAERSNLKKHRNLFVAGLPATSLKPFSFLHMDMDIYPAAREVLLHYSCRLLPGTVLLFDELINYVGWYDDGEMRALREVAALRGIVWEALGVYHEQSVPIVVVENRMIGCGKS